MDDDMARKIRQALDGSCREAREDLRCAEKGGDCFHDKGFSLQV
jgi:hypothetical protein